MRRPSRSYAAPLNDASTLATPHAAYTTRAAVGSTPSARIASTPKAHHTELDTPTITAEQSSGRERGQKNQVQLSCGRRQPPVLVGRREPDGHDSGEHGQHHEAGPGQPPLVTGHHRDRAGHGHAPPGARADRRPGGVALRRRDLPVDELGVRRVRQPRGRAGHDHTDARDGTEPAAAITAMPTAASAAASPTATRAPYRAVTHTTAAFATR